MGVSSLVFKALGLLLVIVLVRFFIRLYQIRSIFREAASKHGVVCYFDCTDVSDLKVSLGSFQHVALLNDGVC
jgi:hypothetical protein